MYTSYKVMTVIVVVFIEEAAQQAVADVAIIVLVEIGSER